MKNKIYIFLPLLLAIAIAAGIFIGSRYNVSSVNSKVFGLGFSRFNKLNDILNYVLEEYVDSVDRDDLIDGSLSAVLKELDPHSAYIPPRNLSALNEPLEGSTQSKSPQEHPKVALFRARQLDPRPLARHQG